MVRYFFILSISLACLLVKTSIANLTVQPYHEATLSHPSSITVCQNHLWVYSASDKNLISFHLDSGDQKQVIDVKSTGISSPVYALECYQEKLLVGTQNQLFLLHPNTLQLSKISLAGTGDGFLRDLFCHESRCGVIRDQVSISDAFQGWKPIPLSDPKSIPNIHSDLEKNPFANWSDHLTEAKPRYFRGLFFPAPSENITSSGIILLDALRMNLVQLHFEHLSSAPLEEKKWGKWGVWERGMMFPRGTAFFDQRFILVSDVGKRVISIYDLSGQHHGLLTLRRSDNLSTSTQDTHYGILGLDLSQFMSELRPHDEVFRAKYPLDITVFNRRIFIADYLDSRVYFLEATDFLDTKEALLSKVKLVRSNYYRESQSIKDHMRTRCLSCHDGLETNSLNLFSQVHSHHPIGVRLSPGSNQNMANPQNIDLPLFQGATISCNTCHDGHHGNHIGDWVTQSGEIKKHSSLPYHLRKSIKSLCSTCHLEKENFQKSHFQDKPPSSLPHKIISCSQCHQMHEADDSLTRPSVTSLCLKCHQTQAQSTFHPNLQTHFPGKQSEMKKVDCTSCHQFHGEKKEFALARHTHEGANGTCLNCHESLKPKIGKTPHFDLDGKGHFRWPNPETACLYCHHPHQKSQPIESTCLKCHQGRKSSHQATISVSETIRAQGIHLTGDKVTCITCHDPHSMRSNEQPSVRNRENLIQFCASCHEQKAVHLFDHFHEQFPSNQRWFE